MRRLGVGVLAVFGALVALGFITAALVDALGWSPSTWAIGAFHSLPRSVRLILELVIGVPLLIGVIAYAILDTLDMTWFIVRPFARLFGFRAAERGSR